MSSEQLPASDRAATAQAYQALREKLNPRGMTYAAWSFFYEVKSPHGRLADIIAVSAWGSRGHEVWGFEVKASRNDWKKELEDPAKADWFVKRCDRWWVLAARPGIVLKDELPPGWGMMERKASGEVWQVVQAARREPVLDREFMALLLTNAFRAQQRSTMADELQQARWKAHEEGVAQGKALCEQSHGTVDREAKEAKEALKAFADATGIHLASWNVERVAPAIRALYHAEEPNRAALNILERLARQGDELAKKAREEAARLRPEAPT